MAKTIIRVELDTTQHLKLMLHLLKHRSIINRAIDEAREWTDEVPELWQTQLTDIEELIHVIQESQNG